MTANVPIASAYWLLIVVNAQTKLVLNSLQWITFDCIVFYYDNCYCTTIDILTSNIYQDTIITTSYCSEIYFKRWAPHKYATWHHDLQLSERNLRDTSMTHFASNKGHTPQSHEHVCVVSSEIGDLAPPSHKIGETTVHSSLRTGTWLHDDTRSWMAWAKLVMLVKSALHTKKPRNARWSYFYNLDIVVQIFIAIFIFRLYLYADLYEPLSHART